MVNKLYTFATNSEQQGNNILNPNETLNLRVETESIIPSGNLNFNDYASRKSLAQGLLDLSLLAANATQLKYLMTGGKEKNEFFTVLLVLVLTSIVLQVIQAVVIVILGIIFDINNTDEHRKADITNNALVGITTISVFINVVISTFEMNPANDRGSNNNGSNFFNHTL